MNKSDIVGMGKLKFKKGRTAPELSFTEIILLRSFYKEKLDKIEEDGFNEKNNNHRIIEERYQILDQDVSNISNQIDWDQSPD